MCPLRFVLVFLSAALAGLLAWRSIRSAKPSPFSDDSRKIETPRGDDSFRGRIFGAGKVLGKGFWVFVDMASGGYLWRAIRESKQMLAGIGHDLEKFMDSDKLSTKKILIQGINAQGLVRGKTPSEELHMGRTTSTQKLVAITLGLLAVLSPLYIDRKTPVEDDDDDGSSRALSLWLPLVLILLLLVINLTCFMDRRIMRFDPYWIHRFGGSSCGIMMLLLVLGFVLKCKASLGG